jgi:serine/threonine protein kinase
MRVPVVLPFTSGRDAVTGGKTAMALDRLTDFAGVAQDVAALPAGTRLLRGQYSITGYLNSGGFGIAYRAQDGLGRDVVLKECFVAGISERRNGWVCPRSDEMLPLQEKALRSFQDEARILARLSHRNIVRILQVFEENGTAYMALSLLQGHDLLEIVEEGKAQLTPSQITSLARRMLAALGHVHDRGYLHCDVAPDNIMVTQDGEPVLIDFGAARRMAQGGVEPHGGFSTVKDGYSPPELYGTQVQIGPYSDLYALGGSLYHAITGTAPVDCQRREAALAKGHPDPLPPLQSRVPGYPVGFLASIDRAMAIRPGARYLTAQDWLRDVAEPAPARDRGLVLLRRAAVSPRAARAVPGMA